jgi:DNA (cytosine-5)-methyltransferase 1
MKRKTNKFLLAHPKNSLEKNSPTCIELFAGAGGLMLGLERSGFKTLLANEVHPHPCLTLKRNFPGVPIIQTSARDVSGLDLLKSAGLCKSYVKRISLVAGGPPCQGFSTAGIKDKNDPRNNLIGDFIRIVKELKPFYFLLENVPGLVTLHDGLLFKNVLNELSSLGYNFSYKVLQVSDYGVPQMRKRLIILGAREGKAPIHPLQTHGNNEPDLLFTSNTLPFVSCGEAIEDLPAIDQGCIQSTYDKQPRTDYQRIMRKGSRILYNHEASKHKKETMDYYGLVPPGGTWLDIPENLRNKKQGVQRWPLNGLSRAITTEPTDFIHPTLNRTPTVRELARIQSFPDVYEFCGQRTTGNKMRRLGYCSQTQQVGNAVPPLFAQAIGKELLKLIK